jgi:hypothetical protein
MSYKSESEPDLQARGCRKKLMFASDEEMSDNDTSGWLMPLEGLFFKKKIILFFSF